MIEYPRTISRMELAADKRPFMDARRMTNVGLALKAGKKNAKTGRPKPREKQNVDVSSAARLAWQVHEGRRRRYLNETNLAINMLGRAK